jgi:nucleoside-diphosphate-sugar epimerase
MKTLITGGGGFLGSEICRQLFTLGFEVTAYQRSPAPQLEEIGIHVVQGDICDISALMEAARGCEAVIHTAGKAGVWGEANEYRRINVQGTQAVIDVCRELAIPYLVHTSSPSVVQAGEDIEGGDESLPYGEHFTAAYPATKAEAEKNVLRANDDVLRTVALRPHLIWGPGDPHLLPRLILKSRGGRLSLPASGKLVDTTHVTNAAQAHVLALRELAGKAQCAGKAYFISNDEPIALGEIIRRLLEAVGIEVKIRAISPKLAALAGAVCETAWRSLGIRSEPPVTRFAAEQLSTAHWFDISAAKKDLGYEPTVSIEQGLSDLAIQKF